MALREIRLEGDPILYRVARPLEKMTDRMQILIDDMFDTMYDGDGVGLAAPQVGILRRIFVVDPADSEEGDEPDPMVFINPVVVETRGEQSGSEGCLSVPGKVGNVTRPKYVKMRAFDRDMKEFELEAEGVLARVVLHEFDHLEGHLYPDMAENGLMDVDDVLEEEERKKEERKRRGEPEPEREPIKKKLRYL